MTYPPNVPPQGPEGSWPPPQPPYRTPQQYGYGGPQLYGYSGPQPGYPYLQPAPPSGGNGKWLLIIGAIVAVLIVVAGGAVFAFTGDSKSGTASGSSSDEDSIRQLFHDVGQEFGKYDKAKEAFEATEHYYCAADQKLIANVPDTPPLDESTRKRLKDLGIEVPDSEVQAPDASTTISDIAVDGDKATASVSSDSETQTLYFRKESGDWKLCMSDMPGLP